jgi:hypothetical protein
MSQLRILVQLGLAIALVGSSSCNKIKNKKHQVSQSIQKLVFNKKDQLFPGFDSTTPDTESNKRRFKDFLGVALTPDIKDIYCKSDRIGIDASYSFVFKCNSSTHESIIKQLNLKPDSLIRDFSTGGFSTNTWWWDKGVSARSKPYSRQQKDLYWHLWRDQKNGKDYFLTYDM